MNPKPSIRHLLGKKTFSHDELVILLSADKGEQNLIFQKASEVKQNNVGNKVYLRGLVEYSNICSKNCFYCGVRSGNKNVRRYKLSESEVLEAAQFVLDQHFASMVIQAGELSSPQNTCRIGELVRKIKQLSQGKIGITLAVHIAICCESKPLTPIYFKRCIPKTPSTPSRNDSRHSKT